MVKKLIASTGDIRDTDSIPGSGRCPGGGHGNPLQYACLENLMGREAWQAASSPWGCRRVGHNLAVEQQQYSVFNKSAKKSFLNL